MKYNVCQVNQKPCHSCHVFHVMWPPFTSVLLYLTAAIFDKELQKCCVHSETSPTPSIYCIFM